MKSHINFLLALLVTLLIARPVDAQSLDERSALNNQPIPCASEEPLRFFIPESMTRIDVRIDGVMCAFRNKIGGFPTINVIRAPLSTGSRALTLSERTNELIRSYGLVGLTDAAVTEAYEMTLHGLPAYSAKVSYTNKNTPMTTLVLIVELPDRSYTVSVLDTEEGFKTSEKQLREVLSTVTVEGAAAIADDKSTKTKGIGTILVATGLALGILYVRRYLKRRNA